MLNKLLFTYLLYIGSDANPTNKIKQGSLIGKYMESRSGKTFSAYLGIPYAKPPIGNLRFKAPIPATQWKGILFATDDGDVCIQKHSRPYLVSVGKEDCLFLNVFTPQLNASNKRSYAVMIFIHGGAFVSGAGSVYGPDFLMDEDIVLVTFNYRLGPFGFMSTGDTILPGNSGLKDQALAIMWVKKNIKAFGGNPRRITIFGESAGGLSVNLHMCSPLTRGLFSAAISQSGTALSLSAFMDRQSVVESTKKLAKQVGCAADSNYDMIRCLQSVDAAKIIQSQQVYYAGDVEPNKGFLPVVEDESEGSFLPDTPVNILKSGKYANVPWISGVNSAEGGLLIAGLHKINQLKYLDVIFESIAAGPKFDNSVKRIQQFYLGNKTIDENTIPILVDLYSDMVYISSTHFSVELHWKYSKQPVYYYLLSHCVQKSFTDLYGVKSFRYGGAAHADELQLLFPTRFTDLDQEDLRYSKLMIRMWTNFAKYRNPTPETDSLITAKWEPVTTAALEYYNIGGGVRTSSNLHYERIEFWREMNKETQLNYTVL